MTLPNNTLEELLLEERRQAEEMRRTTGMAYFCGGTAGTALSLWMAEALNPKLIDDFDDE